MKEYNIKYVLKLISKKEVNFANLESYFDKSLHEEIHYYSINKDVSGNFKWKTVVNIVIDDSSVALNLEELKAKYYRIRDDFLRNMNIEEEDIQSALYKQYYFGDEFGGDYLIISFYSMNGKVEKVKREKNMMEHFNMEKKQNLYKLVHFNQIMEEDKSSKEYQFVFESYLEEINHIENLYNQEFINFMREHSKGFLNPDTRKLAFGEVKILKKNIKIV